MKHVPNPVFQFVKIYFSALLFFTLFRLILFLSETDRISPSTPLSDILFSFVTGLRFDIVISGYILILPFFIFTVLSFFKGSHPVIHRIVFSYIIITFSVAFLVCAVDIPYHNHFFSRLSVSAFEWLDHPQFVFKMIIQEPRYWIMIIPFVLFTFAFYRLLYRILKPEPAPQLGFVTTRIILSFIFLGLISLGMRGRIARKSPLRTGSAYFSQNPFLNQLGLNPNFTLIRSFLDSKKKENRMIDLMDNDLAVSNVQRYLNIRNVDKKFPLLRRIGNDSGQAPGYNVVIVIMESMSAGKMHKRENGKSLTPFLDSISQTGYYFENAYTAGIHTFNGIFSTVFSFPALFRQHPMKESSMRQYHGLFTTLKNKGYSTAYFTTHDGQFDNVEGYLKANNCDMIVSQQDYPADQVKSTLGVPDDYLFEFSIPRLNAMNNESKPFVATFMTASDHGPYYVPEYFKPSGTEIKEQVIEYADYSLKKFIELASKQKWFERTLFVFVADHGAPLDGTYDMSIDYNHTPLLFYAPGIIKTPERHSEMAGQIDVFPTIMGLLKLPYDNNTLGIDLLREKRPYIFFNADDKYGVINNEWFLIVKEDKTESLYKYRMKDTRNYAQANPEIVRRMNNYAKSNLQAFQYILKLNRQ